jgi:outer membrane lipoprotein
MNKYLLSLAILVSFLSLSCTPVLRKDIMDVAIRDLPMADLKKTPELYVGKLFVLGGIIVNTKATAEGSLIEAVYVPVDSRGYLQSIGITHARFLALFPKESGFLDPVIFRPDREITFAGEFGGMRDGKIEEMEYSYPFFKIKEIYLWEEKRVYYYPYYYEPYPYWGWDYPYWWDRPWWWSHRLPPYWW